MPGQCYKCGTEFSMFKKERGCKNCGYAFCNKCLNEKPVPVPKKNNEKHHVCHGCYKVLTGAAPANTEPVKYDLPEAYIKRMAALEQKNSQPKASGVSVNIKSKDGHRIPESLSRLDKADREIALRLEKLKEEDKPKEPITDAHLYSRLAQLKGQPVQATSKPVYQPPDQRSETQQVDDLLAQLSEEVALDSVVPDPAQEIEARLRQFRQSDGQKSSKPAVDDINLNQDDKVRNSGNNLNVIDKVGQVTTKPYSKNISGSSILEDKDLDEIHKMIADVAKEVRSDAKKAIEDLQRDKELMDRLKVIQATREKNKHADDAASVNSDTDNTTKTSETTNAISNTTEESDDESDEDVAAARLVQRFVEESKIDDAVGNVDSPSVQKNLSKKKKAGKTVERKHLNSEPSQAVSKRDNSEDSDYDDSDELPYCCMCMEDAGIRCRDCDMDLYCDKCFVECHQKMDINDHRTMSYKPPKGYR